jgi:hypothetical protein
VYNQILTLDNLKNQENKIKRPMMILKYIVAITLVLGWVVGYFGFNTGKEIHLLLGMALMVCSVIIINKEKGEIKTLIKGRYQSKYK